MSLVLELWLDVNLQQAKAMKGSCPSLSIYVLLCIRSPK